MEITARGWGRNMGDKRIVKVDLEEIAASREPRKLVHFGRPGLFQSFGEASVAWGQSLRFTGDYRMQVDFTYSDVVTLFKAMFGSELDVSLLENHGFTVSPELKKKILSEIKLADLTIGDLAGLGASKEQSEPVKPAGEIKSFLRRV